VEVQQHNVRLEQSAKPQYLFEARRAANNLNARFTFQKATHAQLN
jgi:hypothetical protein